MAEKGYGVPAYAYAANNPLYWSDPTGLAFDETCWAACIDEVNPLENNPLMCGDSDSSTGNDGSDFPWGSAISLAAGPYWKPFGYQAGASHFTSPWRLMNIASRSVSGRPVFPGPATKLMGRASVMWIVAAGITSWGVIGACAAECSGR